MKDDDVVTISTAGRMAAALEKIADAIPGVPRGAPLLAQHSLMGPTVAVVLEAACEDGYQWSEMKTPNVEWPRVYMLKDPDGAIVARIKRR